MKKFKKIVPYILTFSAFLFTNAPLQPYTKESKAAEPKDFKPKYTTSAKITTDYDTLILTPEYRATILMNTYIYNAVDGTQRIINDSKKMNYARAVRAELPGAPSSPKRGMLHCLYGQYMQLNRTLTELGDTIKIIPRTEDNAHMSSLSFKRHMTKLYDNEKYPNAIYSGHLYATDNEYNRALNKYVGAKVARVRNCSDSLRAKFVTDFQRDNFCATMLNPGAIIIVSTGHAVMYLGQGRIENKQFVSDSINGTAICCSYNTEHAAVILSKWDTQKSFVADLKIIAQKRYEQEKQYADSIANANMAKTYVKHTKQSDCDRLRAFALLDTTTNQR